MTVIATNRDKAMRCFGTIEAYEHAIVHLRMNTLASIAGERLRIPARHVRKLAAFKQRLDSLKELEFWFKQQIEENLAAYKRFKTSADKEQAA